MNEWMNDDTLLSLEGSMFGLPNSQASHDLRRRAKLLPLNKHHGDIWHYQSGTIMAPLACHLWGCLCCLLENPYASIPGGDSESLWQSRVNWDCTSAWIPLVHHFGPYHIHYATFYYLEYLGSVSCELVLCILVCNGLKFCHKHRVQF